MRRVVAGAFVEGSFIGTGTGFRLERRKFLRPCEPVMELLEDSKEMLINILFLCVQEKFLLIIPIQWYLCIVYSGIPTSHPEQVSAVLNDKERKSIFMLRN